MATFLQLLIAGVADNRGPWDVFLNSTIIGSIPTNASANNFQKVLTYTFNVPIGLLTGLDTALLNINVPDQGDGYSIDYSELRITTTVVPVPAALWLFGSGLLGMIGIARRKKAA